MHAVQPVHRPVATTSWYRSCHCVLSALVGHAGRESIRHGPRSPAGGLRGLGSRNLTDPVLGWSDRPVEVTMGSEDGSRAVAVVFALGFVLAACGGDDDGGGDGDGSTGTTGTRHGWHHRHRTGAGGGRRDHDRGLRLRPQHDASRARPRSPSRTTTTRRTRSRSMTGAWIRRSRAASRPRHRGRRGLDRLGLPVPPDDARTVEVA